MKLLPGKILLAIDGEPHTEAAVAWALRLASALQTGIVALHVVETYLAQFADELYAQGRQAYRDHLERCLVETAASATAACERQAEASGVACEVKVRHGTLVEELLAEIDEGEYGLLVLGQRTRSGVRQRLSRKLADKVAASQPDIAILVVPEAR